MLEEMLLRLIPFLWCDVAFEADCVLELCQRLTIGLLVNCSEFCEVFEMLDVHYKCVHCTVYVQS